MDPGSQSAAEPRAGSSPRWGLGDVVWVYLAGLVAGNVLGAIGLGITQDNVQHPGALTFALSFAGQYGSWFGGIAWVASQKGRSLRQDFGFALRISSWRAVFIGIGLALFGNAMLLPLTRWISERQDVVEDLRSSTGLKRLVIVLGAGVVAPVVEELMFRGLLLRALRRRMQPVLAIAVQALVFGFAHTLSPSWGNFAAVPGITVLGVASGVAAEETGDLSASILMHFGVNLLALVLLF